MTVKELSLRRPTLDEVFLAVTGHHLEPDDLDADVDPVADATPAA